MILLRSFILYALYEHKNYDLYWFLQPSKVLTGKAILQQAIVEMHNVLNIRN